MTATRAADPAASDGNGYEDTSETRGRTRRGFIASVSKAAFALLIAGGRLVLGPARAEAVIEGCCNLVYSSSYYCMYYCGAGPHPPYVRSWTCNSGGYSCRCYECTDGSSCWYGPFYCSYASC